MNYQRSLWVGIGAAAAMWALTGAASAALLTLVVEPPQTLGPQSTSAPCIIAATNCSQPVGMDYTNYTQKGSVPAYNEVSPTYTVAQLAALGLTTFNIAIDVNTADHGETLQLFEVLVNNVAIYTYTGPGVIGGTDGNGNGYGDWSLRTVDLTGQSGNLVFHAVWDNASDGGESFFLVSTTAVPAPLAGAGLPGLIVACGGLIGLARRRRRLQAA